jgi:helix-turn-helix protein
MKKKKEDDDNNEEREEKNRILMFSGTPSIERHCFLKYKQKSINIYF